MGARKYWRPIYFVCFCFSKKKNELLVLLFCIVVVLFLGAFLFYISLLIGIGFMERRLMTLTMILYRYIQRKSISRDDQYRNR